MIPRIVAIMTLALLTPLAACHRAKVNGNARGSFAIHTLRDTTLSVADAATRDLGALLLEEVPLVTAKDIAAYSWSQQSFSVRPDLQSRLVALGNRPYRSGGIPFVVVVGDDRVYLGAFWYSYSSSLPRVPYIMLPPHGSLKLLIPGTAGVVDPRGDQRVYDSLKRAGVLVE